MGHDIVESNQLILLQSHIIDKKNYIMALQKRMITAREKFATKNDHEKNEVDILLYETSQKIISENKKVKSMEFQFQNKMFEILSFT